MFCCTVLILARALQVLGRDVEIGKLFAKHASLDDQVTYLTTKNPSIVVGTPNRVHALVEKDALSLDHCKLVVVDMARDVKKMSVLDAKDTGLHFFQFYHQHLHNRFKNKKMKLVLF